MVSHSSPSSSTLPSAMGVSQAPLLYMLLTQDSFVKHPGNCVVKFVDDSCGEGEIPQGHSLYR